MSVRLMAMVWTLDLSHSEQTVLMAFADHANDDGRCFPGLRYVAWKTGYSLRQVQRIVDGLERARLLVTVKEPKRGRATEYQLLLAAGKPKIPYREWDDNMSPHRSVDNSNGVTSEPNGVTSETQWGDTAMSSLTSEPSNQDLEDVENPGEQTVVLSEWLEKRGLA